MNGRIASIKVIYSTIQGTKICERVKIENASERLYLCLIASCFTQTVQIKFVEKKKEKETVLLRYVF